MRIIKDLKNIAIQSNVILHEAMSFLDKNGLQILLIVDEANILIGVLTDGDIRRYLLKDPSMNISVTEIANKDFFAVTDAEIDRISILFKQKTFRHIPITNSSGELKCLALRAVSYYPENTFQIPIVIMAGGKGSRLAPLTRIIPKALIPIGEQTMIEKIMEGFHEQNFKEFKIITNHKKKLIKSYLDETNLPYEISYLEEDKFLGTIGGIKLFESQLPDCFLLTNCDVITDLNYHEFINNHIKTSADLSILGVKKTTNIQYGVLDLDASSQLKSVTEKPKYTHVINAGIYILSKNVLDFIPKGDEFNMDQLINTLLDNNKKITSYVIEDGWFDIGQFDEYRKLLQNVID